MTGYNNHFFLSRFPQTLSQITVFDNTLLLLNIVINSHINIYPICHFLYITSTWLANIVWSSSRLCCLNFLLNSSISTSDSWQVLNILLTCLARRRSLTWHTKIFLILMHPLTVPLFFFFHCLQIANDGFFVFFSRPFLSSSASMTGPILLTHPR